MKTHQKLFFLGLTLGSSLLFSCSEEDSDITSIGTGEVKIGIGVKIPTSTIPGARISTVGLNVNSGFLQIKDIELETEGVDKNGEFEREIKLKFPEIKKINFNELDASVDFFINIPAGNYEEIEFEIDVIDDKSEPSIQLDGTFQYLDGRAVPFKFQVFGNDDDDFDFNVELEAEDDDALFNIEAVKNPLALLEINAKGWFSSITTSELEKAVLTDGILLITKDKNAAIYQKVEAKIKASTDIELELR
ncbi:MAG: hypothetical protein PSV36_11165 [Algoriphagus sp.]|nr:hypothetical protein [Algoriphagus sp.]